MKKYFISGLLSLLTVIFLSLGFVSHAAAFDPFQKDPTACSQTDSSGTKSVVCNADGSKNPITGSNGVINKIANIFALVAGIAAVIVIILGGFQYVLSGGESAKVSKAKNMIIYAVIGLIVIVVSRSIVGLAVSKL